MGPPISPVMKLTEINGRTNWLLFYKSLGSLVIKNRKANIFANKMRCFEYERNTLPVCFSSYKSGIGCL